MATGERQGDLIFTLTFNLVLHMVKKELRVEGAIVFKTKQACTYAEDIVLMARSLYSVREIFEAYEEKCQIIGIRINKDKTKYMYVNTGVEKIEQFIF